VAIKYAILGLLHYTDLHGYRIKKHIERSFGHMWSVNYGQIYPALKQLKEDGLVTMREVNQEAERGPGRKLYSLTESGRREFARWLAESPERGMMLRDPFLLRFPFFGFGDRDRALQLIDEQFQVYEQALARRHEAVARLHDQDIYVRIIAEMGLKLNQFVLEWLHDAREQIEQACADDVTAKPLVEAKRSGLQQGVRAGGRDEDW
jgi:DNA-binding PadR family transcriptional regulator